MTAQPTPEYQRHHDVEAPRVDATAFRRGWQVKTKLDGLLRDDRISPAAYAAGKRWRADWEMAMERSVASKIGAFVRSGGASAGPLVRLDAVTRLREANGALGGSAWRLMICVVAQDFPWTETGRVLGVSDNTARQRAAKALEALGRHYARVDGTRFFESRPNGRRAGCT